MKIAGLFFGLLFAVSSAHAADQVPAIHLQIDGLENISQLERENAEIVASRVCFSGPIGQSSHVECDSERIPVEIDRDELVTRPYRMRFNPFKTDFSIRITIYKSAVHDFRNALYNFSLYSEQLHSTSVITWRDLVSEDYRLIYRSMPANRIKVLLSEKDGRQASIPAGFYTALKFSIDGAGSSFDDSAKFSRSTNTIDVQAFDFLVTVPKGAPTSATVTVFANDGKRDYRYYRSTAFLKKAPVPGSVIFPSQLNLVNE